MSDVTIEIFGQISNIAAIAELEEQASEEGMIDWEVPFDISDLFDAASKKSALCLTRQDTRNLFEGVRHVCREIGLPYVVSYGPSGADDLTLGIAWKPGMTEEHEFETDGSTVMLKLNDVAEAARAGIDAVNALVADYSNLAEVGYIEIEPGLEDAYFDSVDEEASSRP